jgi:hypothetical protein
LLAAIFSSDCTTEFCTQKNNSAASDFCYVALVDTVAPEIRRAHMRLIRTEGAKPERAIRAALVQLGMRFDRNPGISLTSFFRITPASSFTDASGTRMTARKGTSPARTLDRGA